MRIMILPILVATIIAAPAALAQNATSPNSGTGVSGLPGNKSGPAQKPGQHNSTVSGQDQSKVPGQPGNESGPAKKPPKNE